MANSPRAGGGAQRPNGATQNKICQFKLVLLGESAVGKSSLVLRFVKGQFHEYQESTIGAAFLTQTVCIDDTTVKFEIWDTAGQERCVLRCCVKENHNVRNCFFIISGTTVSPQCTTEVLRQLSLSMIFKIRIVLHVLKRGLKSFSDR